MITLGLTTDQADTLLDQYGPNELPAKETISELRILLSQVQNFMTVLLVFAALLSLVTGDVIDSAIIFLILFLNIGLGFWQEYKASKELEALRQLEVLTTRVIRNGKEERISAKELVPGDIIVLEAGDKIPADAQLFEALDLTTNESALTGESLAVVKTIDLENNLIYFGTVIASGRGKAKVVQTGQNTRFGKIALTLITVDEEQTPLEKTLNSLGKKIALLAIGVAIAVFFIRILQGWHVTEVFFTSIALMVAAVPEGLPAVITISLAFGVHRMYQKKGLVRRMSAVESLGAATVICTDKTGTLTKNEMRVKEIIAGDKAQHDMLIGSIVCNSASLVLKVDGTNFDVLGDTTEGALLLWAQENGKEIELVRKEGLLLHEIPFSLARRIMSVVWQNGQNITMYTKGAPEVVLARCTLSDSQIEKYTQEYEQLASKGLRVLAFAKKELSHTSKDITYSEEDLTFLGFIGIADAAREEAKEAILKAKRAGIKVVMITGDNELTARAIGQEVGLLSDGDEIMTGIQLDKLDDTSLSEQLDKIKIFARVVPEHKLRIVKVFQNRGDVVAVTGDGVNDSLALKQAEVGIAMGKTGTDVAKEAADIIILDDNFATIVSAIEEGRLIYTNILKVVRFLMTGNFSELLVIVVAVLLGLPTPLLPVQILWVNFVTDGLPALALVRDPAARNLMHIPPQKHADTLLNLSSYRSIIAGALVISIITLGGYILGLHLFTIEIARAYAFTLLVITQMVLIFIIRRHQSIYSNKYLVMAVGLVVLAQVLILSLSPLRAAFKL